MEQTLPAEIKEALQDVPASSRKEIEHFLFTQYRMISRVSPDAEVMKRVTPEHITTMLQTQENAMQNTFKENHEKRIFALIGVRLRRESRYSLLFFSRISRILWKKFCMRLGV